MRHARIPYMDHTELYKGRVRILRGINAEVMPDFLGSWPPRNNTAECRELYCCTMLALLKPWRDWKDLKGTRETWEEAFRDFTDTCSQRCKDIINNFQFYYDSQDTATTNRQQESQDDGDIPMFDQDDADTIQPQDDGSVAKGRGWIDNWEDPSKLKERQFGENAVKIAQDVGVFNSNETPSSDFSSTSTVITTNMLESLPQWRAVMKSTICSADEDDEDGESDVDIDMLEHRGKPTEEGIPSICIDEGHKDKTSELESIMHSLTDDQRRACVMLSRHLEGYQRGDTKQLLMLVMGAGGVGKSVVIKAIEDVFRYNGQSDLLAKTATSGVAASHIQGVTLHFWAGLSLGRPPRNGTLRPSSAAIIRRRKKNIEHVRYLIIDEVSMLTLHNLGILSKIVADIHDPQGENRDMPFGGKLNVILVGDFHQFPPVVKKSALYRTDQHTDDTWAEIGKSIFACFDTAVLLKKQMRSVDPEWSELLERARYWKTTDDDEAILDSLTLTNPQCPKTDFEIHPWNNAVLITTRRTVRNAWNKAMVEKLSRKEGKTVLVCPSNDYTGRRKNALNDAEREANLRDEGEWDLASTLELFEGMRVIITFNIAVESHLANGSIGTLEKIYLDPRESPVDRGANYHRLKFKPDGIIPVESSKSSRHVELRSGRKVFIHREQFAVMAAYAFTEAGLTPFNAYVALSRSKSREFTRLLRKCDAKIFRQPLQQGLKLFDERLSLMDEENKKEFEGRVTQNDLDNDVR